MSAIHSTKFYTIHEPTFMCCDQSQFTYYCKAHEEKMGCYFCSFDPEKECGCITSAVEKGNA